VRDREGGLAVAACGIGAKQAVSLEGIERGEIGVGRLGKLLSGQAQRAGAGQGGCRGDVAVGPGPGWLRSNARRTRRHLARLKPPVDGFE
jgi:hypothetical protein